MGRPSSFRAQPGHITTGHCLPCGLFFVYNHGREERIVIFYIHGAQPIQKLPVPAISDKNVCVFFCGINKSKTTISVPCCSVFNITTGDNFNNLPRICPESSHSFWLAGDGNRNFYYVMIKVRKKIKI